MLYYYIIICVTFLCITDQVIIGMAPASVVVPNNYNCTMHQCTLIQFSFNIFILFLTVIQRTYLLHTSDTLIVKTSHGFLHFRRESNISSKDNLKATDKMVPEIYSH
jgi:hypothetical protein